MKTRNYLAQLALTLMQNSSLLFHLITKYGHPIRLLLQISKNILADSADHSFMEKAKIFIHFTGFSIWDWDMILGCKNLGS